jgi:hypothetical protein
VPYDREVSVVANPKLPDKAKAVDMDKNKTKASESRNEAQSHEK